MSAVRELALVCAAGCGRCMEEAGWLAVLGIVGQPAYVICPDCERLPAVAEQVEELLAGTPGCKGTGRTETDGLADVIDLTTRFIRSDNAGQASPRGNQRNRGRRRLN
jgi:hypothetical protein